ncbi:MAG: hypothetical protein ACOC2Y_05455 [Spirochaetota bacterium]
MRSLFPVLIALTVLTSVAAQDGTYLRGETDLSTLVAVPELDAADHIDE